MVLGVEAPATLMATRVEPEPDGAACAKCGEVHRGCRAHSKRTKLACTQPTMPGLPVCYWHGGASNRARTAGRRRIALAQAGELLGIPVQVDPGKALLDAVCEAAGNVEFLRTQVQLLQLRHDVPLASTDAAGSLRMDVALALYNDERDRLANYSRLAVAAGVGERYVRLAEQQGALVAGMMVALLASDQLGLTPQQQAVGRQVAAHLLAHPPALPAHGDAHETTV